MSADNGITIKKVSDIEYQVFEYSVSSDWEVLLATFDNLEKALKYRTEYSTEYGISFSDEEKGDL